MHLHNRAITLKHVVQTVLTGLLAIGLVLFAGGCGGAGANGGGDGDGDGDGGDTTAPAAPSGLTGDSGDSVVELSWSAVDASDLDGYNVYRATESIGDVSGMSPQNGSLLSETGYADSGAENGTTYHYVVTAVDTAGNGSDPSNEIKKTPFDDPPDRP